MVKMLYLLNAQTLLFKIKTMTFNHLIFLFIVSIYLLSHTSCVSSSAIRSTQERPLIVYSALPPASNSGGMCYSKYIAKDVYQVDQMDYAIFTGNNLKDNENIETRTIILTPKKSEWVKRKKSPDCVSINPHDCYVARYEETPAITRDITIVKDTSLVKAFKLEKIKQANLVQKGGAEGWIRIVCPNTLTLKYIENLQTALQDSGFYDGEINGILTSSTLQSLKSYQTNNNLTEGYFDLDSMRSLGLPLR